MRHITSHDLPIEGRRGDTPISVRDRDSGPALPGQEDRCRGRLLDVEVLEEVTRELGEAVGQPAPGGAGPGAVELGRRGLDLIQEAGHPAVAGLELVDDGVEVRRARPYARERAHVLGAMVGVHELAIAQAVHLQLEQRATGAQLVQRRRADARSGAPVSAASARSLQVRRSRRNGVMDLLEFVEQGIHEVACPFPVAAVRNGSSVGRGRILAKAAVELTLGKRDSTPVNYVLANGECRSFQRALEFIGRRWVGAVLLAGAQGARRFGEYRKLVPGISIAPRPAPQGARDGTTSWCAR